MAALATPSFAESVKACPISAETSAMFAGWYTFQHAGGEFEVCLRPGGVFFCPSFQVPPSRRPSPLLRLCSAPPPRARCSPP